MVHVVHLELLSSGLPPRSLSVGRGTLPERDKELWGHNSLKIDHPPDYKMYLKSPLVTIVPRPPLKERG